MGTTTGIRWTDHTWNPWRGCHKVTPGCDHCYMFRDQTRYGNDPNVVARTAPATFNQPPTKWREPAKVFTCSWSDFFIKEADPWRAEAWDIIRRTPHLTYQILTKRVGRVHRCLPPDWGDGYPNVWLGVSIESNRQAFRAAQLRMTPAVVHFVSAEPLLGPLTEVGLTDIEWVITGGESGGPPERRLVEQVDGRWTPKPEALRWVRGIRDRCADINVAFFHKQWGGPHPDSSGYLLDGREWSEFPQVTA